MEKFTDFDPSELNQLHWSKQVDLIDQSLSKVIPVIKWYFKNVYGKVERPGILPFYCDPERVGAFAISTEKLSAGHDSATFHLFVMLSMFQARRDVLIMQQQRDLKLKSVKSLIDHSYIKKSVTNHFCTSMVSSEAFDAGCDVSKVGKLVDCFRHPASACHVKDATIIFNCMGDMGKLPTSAYLHIWKDSGISKLFRDVLFKKASPSQRADLLVKKFMKIYRIGRKLATMFVSALSVPTLAVGYTPWFPEVDGNELIIVDTNVASAIMKMRKVGASRTYEASIKWIRALAGLIDLNQFHPNVPSYSPRLVQQALYAFCSKSNRLSRNDPCKAFPNDCSTCSPSLCPFAKKKE